MLLRLPKRILALEEAIYLQCFNPVEYFLPLVYALECFMLCSDQSSL